MNTNLSDRGQAWVLVVILLAVIIAAGMYLQAHNSSNDVVVRSWSAVSNVVDTLSTPAQSCTVYTYANGMSETVCR